MDLREQLDRAVGEPTTPGVPVEPLLVAGRRVVRRRRAVAAGGTMAAVGLVGLLASQVVTGTDPDPAPAGPAAVQVDSCDGVPALPGLEVVGAGELCVSPELEVADRVDHPVPGRASVALQLTDADGNGQNVLVVFGDRGLPDSMALPVHDPASTPDPEPLDTWVDTALTERDRLGWAERDPSVVPVGGDRAACADVWAPGSEASSGRRRATAWWTEDGTLCLNPDWRVVEQIDSPVADTRSHAFTLVDPRGRVAQSLMVWRPGDGEQGGLEIERGQATLTPNLAFWVATTIEHNPPWQQGPGLAGGVDQQDGEGQG